MNVMQLKLNILIRDIQNIAVEIDALNKRISNIELILLDCNIPINTEQGNNDNGKDKCSIQDCK